MRDDAAFPHQPDFSKIETGPPLHDSNIWPEKKQLSREISEQALDNFDIK